MSLPNEVYTTVSNTGAAFERGTICTLNSGGAAAVAAVDATGIVLVARQNAAANGRFGAMIVGQVEVLLETGLSPVKGQTVYVSGTAGRGTTAAPSPAVPLGSIEDASKYSASNPRVTIALGGIITGAANASEAQWDPTKVRFFFLDNDNGDDSNMGYIDADGGTTFTTTQTAAVAIKTSEQLRAILPRNGAGRSAVVLIKGRSDEGNYQNKAGGNDYLDVAYTGYLYIAFKGSDHTNNALDRVRLGGVIAEGGPNSDQSWTVDSFSGVAVTVAAGTLPVEDDLVGLAVQWVGNVTAALTSENNGAHFRVSDTVFSLNFDGTAPANGDQFFLTKPGVVFTDIRGNAAGPGSSDFAGSPTEAFLLAGITCSSAMNQRSIGRFRMSFMRFEGSTTFDGVALETSGTYPTENGAFVISDNGFDARGSFTAQNAPFCQIQQATWHASLNLRRLPVFNIGEGCYSASKPNLRYAGYGVNPGETAADGATLGSPNASGKPGFRLPSGIAIRASNCNVAGIDLDGASDGIDIEGICDLSFKDLRGTVTGPYVLDFSSAEKSRAVADDGIAATAATAQILLAGAVTKTFASLAADNWIDAQGNEIQTDTATANKLTRTTDGVILNVPLLAADPASPANGDIWINNGGADPILKVQAGGVTKEITFS